MTKVTRTTSAGGTVEDWDTEATPGPAIFDGKAGAYYQEKRRAVTATDQRDVLIDRFLFVNSRDFPEIKTGDTISFQRRLRQGKWGSTQTGEVLETEEKEHPSATVLGTIRLPLEVT